MGRIRQIFLGNGRNYRPLNYFWILFWSQPKQINFIPVTKTKLLQGIINYLTIFFLRPPHSPPANHLCAANHLCTDTDRPCPTTAPAETPSRTPMNSVINYFPQISTNYSDFKSLVRTLFQKNNWFEVKLGTTRWITTRCSKISQVQLYFTTTLRWTTGPSRFCEVSTPTTSTSRTQPWSGPTATKPLVRLCFTRPADTEAKR